MQGDAKPGGPSAEDLATMSRVAAVLADGVAVAIPGWVVRSVESVWASARTAPLPDDVRRAAEAAGVEAGRDITPRVRRLLELDIDDQTTNPLSIIRPATRYPTAVLRDAGVPPVGRDVEAYRQFPEDPYDLTPMTFADLEPDLHEAGIVWGAAKAHVHLARRRAEGRQ